MATVINLAKDTRAAELGQGVASFLDRMKDKRIDGLQQELMESIGGAKDEAEATAFMGDPKFQEVVTDNDRFSAVVTHFNNAPLGTQPITGYDKDGNQQILNLSERDDPAEAMRSAGLTLERSRLFYAVDPENDFDIPAPLGRHTGIEGAKEALPTDRILANQIFMDQEEATSFMNFRTATTSAQDQRANRLLADERFQFTKEGGHSPFANLEADREELGEEFYQDARKRLVHIWGRTPTDIKLKYQQELVPEGAQIHATSEQMVLMMDMIVADQNIITGSAKIPAIFNNIGAELKTIAGGFGLTLRPLEDYDPWFEANGLGGRSTAFKNMISTIALGVAAAHGQTGRSLSDKDFDRFLGIAGINISSGANFVTNMNELMRSSQRQFNTRYAIMTRDPATGTPGNWEAEHGAFPSFGSSKNTEEEWRTTHPILSEGLIFPGGTE